MNSICLTGRLTRDPELRYTQDGKAVCHFSIAVSRPFAKDVTDFFECAAFGRTGETIAEHMAKGRRIGVTGALHTNNYTARDGKQVKSFTVTVSTFDFLSDKAQNSPVIENRSEWDSLGQEINPNATAGESDADLPF